MPSEYTRPADETLVNKEFMQLMVSVDLTKHDEADCSIPKRTLTS
jgi:hypothetical protein